MAQTLADRRNLVFQWATGVSSIRQLREESRGCFGHAEALRLRMHFRTSERASLQRDSASQALNLLGPRPQFGLPSFVIQAQPYHFESRIGQQHQLPLMRTGASTPVYYLCR